MRLLVLILYIILYPTCCLVLIPVCCWCWYLKLSYIHVCCLVLITNIAMWRRPEPRYRRQESGAKLSQAVSVGRWHWARAEGSDDWDVTGWAPAQWSVLLLTNKEIFCNTQLQVATLPPIQYVITKTQKKKGIYELLYVFNFWINEITINNLLAKIFFSH